MAQIGATIAKAIRSALVSRIDVIPENSEVNVETTHKLLGSFEPLFVYLLVIEELVCLNSMSLATMRISVRMLSHASSCSLCS